MSGARPQNRRGQRRLGEIRELTRDDLTALANCETRRSLPAVSTGFRDSHHMVARLFAFGYDLDQISDLSGYSRNRVKTLGQDPAFQELVAQKRKKIDEKVDEHADEFGHLLSKNMIMAERQIAEQLEEAEESGERIPLRNLLSVSRDAADRRGYGKQNVQFNVNSDFGALLDRAVKESTKVIEGTAISTQPIAPQASVASEVAVPSQLKRRV